ncbi:MAG: lysine--tRNA ligase [Thermoplasmata archaeon]|nr:lysine--tRNA ligase [Thermoplasmata archaeon]
MHWADVEAERLSRLGEEHVIATGITPSGHIHIGNMREILTGDLLARAARDRGLDVKLVYIADTFDPLRKVYPFLDERIYEEHVGRPLSRIPCPCGSHQNYAAHFLEPFLTALEDLGVEHETIHVDRMYREGKYVDVVKTAMDHRDTVRDILSRISGREMPEGWWPYTPICPSCGRMGWGEITLYHWPTIEYRCGCGFQGEIDLRNDGGKLPWRVEWPARWYMLGVTCEPFGKDHAAAGGSYDTGAEIIRRVYGREPPHPVVYEWIQLKGKGAMSSSTGVVVRAVDMLKMTPPEVLRFLIARYQPSRHIEFDPGLGLLSLVDEYDAHERYYFGLEEPQGVKEEKMEDMKRTYVLSQPGSPADSPPPTISYRHLATLVQIYPEWEGLKRAIIRSHPDWTEEDVESPSLRKRMEAVRFWLDNYAPEMVKFSLLRQPPEIHISGEEKHALAVLRRILSEIPWEAEDVHNAVYAAQDETGVPARNIFRLAYNIFIGKDRGPRLGFFLSSLDREMVLERIGYYTEGEKRGGGGDPGKGSGG